MTKRVNILGVPVDAVTMAAALERLRGMLSSNVSNHVATPNAEMPVESHKSPALRDILQKTALNIPDSQSVVWFAGLPERVTGVDTVEALCGTLTEEHPVFLLGAGEGIAERAGSVLRATNPRLKIAGTFAGSPRADEAPAIIERVNASGARVLFVAYGAPAQEFWIDRHLPRMQGIRIAMGVGGAFDFLAGVQVRAPRFLRSIGLEWAWRFARQPTRWKRMWNAVVVFPWLVFTSRR